MTRNTERNRLSWWWRETRDAVFTAYVFAGMVVLVLVFCLIFWPFVLEELAGRGHRGTYSGDGP